MEILKRQEIKRYEYDVTKQNAKILSERIISSDVKIDSYIKQTKSQIQTPIQI